MPYVYLVTSPNINVVKVGRWSNNLKSLMSRYKTYYGQAASLYAYATNNDKHIEKQFMTHFANMNVSNELFKNVDDSLGIYRKYLLHHTKSKEEAVNHSDVKVADNTRKTLWTLDYMDLAESLCQLTFTFEVNDNVVTVEYMGTPFVIKLDSENYKQKLDNVFTSIVYQMVRNTCKVLESDKYCDKFDHVRDNNFMLTICNTFGEEMFSATCNCDPTLDSDLWRICVVCKYESDKDIQGLIDTVMYHVRMFVP